MKQAVEHPWNLSEYEALTLQRELATRVERADRHDDIRIVAGVDVAYEENTDRLVAAAVLLDLSDLRIVERTAVEDVARFPYLPGFFSFRELPPIAATLEKLELEPDVIVCDGQGYAHPRRFGLACHIGVLFDVPTIGCAKTLLTGRFEPPALERGSGSPIIDGPETVGTALRTQDGTWPAYVSVGQRLSVETCCDLVLKLSPRYRLPETTRAADQAVKALLKTTTYGASA